MLSVCHNLLDAKKKKIKRRKVSRRVVVGLGCRSSLWHSNFQGNIWTSVAADFDFRELPKRK